MTKTAHRSHSQVSQLRRCGEAYRLERVEKVPSRPSWAAVAGVSIHAGTELVDRALYSSPESVESLVAAGSREALLRLSQEVQYRTNDGFPPDTWQIFTRRAPHQDEDYWVNQGIPTAIRAYSEWRVGNPQWQLAEIPGFGPAIEVPFEITLGDVPVKGFIDRIFTYASEDIYCPFDLKSNLAPKADEQLGLYAHAIRAAIRWPVNWGYFLTHLKTGVAKLSEPRSLTHWTEFKLRSIYMDADYMIEHDLFLPSPGEACFTCSVSDHCNYTHSVL